MEKISGVLDSLPYLLKMPSNRIRIDYDEEADVLYISFRKPQQANDSVMEDDIIYHYHDEELVGITILHAKNKAGEQVSLEIMPTNIADNAYAIRHGIMLNF